MKLNKWNQRFLTSTRGRIVAMLRGSECTVSELAEALKLTDNAVRAHLATLERDGLVLQCGVRRGARKPHFSYSLTPEAEQLFPKAYGVLLNELLAVLQLHFAREKKEELLREVGRRMAASYLSDAQHLPFEERMAIVLKAFGDLGGLAEVERRDDLVFIRGDSCPLGGTVTSHPEMCRLVETLVAEIMGVPVEERCKRQDSPQCCFEAVAAAG